MQKAGPLLSRPFQGNGRLCFQKAISTIRYSAFILMFLSNFRLLSLFQSPTPIIHYQNLFNDPIAGSHIPAYPNILPFPSKSSRAFGPPIHSPDLGLPPIRCADLRSLRFAPLSSAYLRVAALTFDSLRLPSIRSAYLRFAPLTFHSLRLPSILSAYLRFAPLTFDSLHLPSIGSAYLRFPPL
jgi:branched-subunit amino acid transport protein